MRDIRRKNAHENHIRVELRDTHKKYQCPKRNSCFHCHKAGHQKSNCSRKEEEMEME
jgi:hypothetical protein